MVKEADSKSAGLARAGSNPAAVVLSFFFQGSDVIPSSLTPVAFSVGMSHRIPELSSLKPDFYKVNSRSLRVISYGNNEIELSNVEQV